MFKRVVVRVAKKDRNPSSRDSAAKILKEAFPSGPKEMDMLVIDLAKTEAGLPFLDECVAWYQENCRPEKTTLIFRSAPEAVKEALGRLSAHRKVRIYAQDHPGFPSYPIEMEEGLE